MKLIRIHLRYHPPAIILEYSQGGLIKRKAVELLELAQGVNIENLATNMIAVEPLLSADNKEQIEKCLTTLREKLEEEGPAGKKFYIYKTLQTHLLPLTNVAFDKNGQRCLTGSYDRTCKIWNIQDGKEIHSLEGHTNVVYCVGFNFPQCDMVITGSFDKSSRLWNAETGECLAVLSGHEGEVIAAHFSPDGNMAATASMDNTARLYASPTGQEVLCYVGHTGEVVALQFDKSTGQHLITGSFDGTVSMWDVRVKDRVAVFIGHRAEISNCLFNWDCSLVASSSVDKTARLWDSRQRTCLATICGHDDEVLDIAFDWCGQRLATASNDCTARVFDVGSDFRELAVMKGHREEVSKETHQEKDPRILRKGLERFALKIHGDQVYYMPSNSLMDPKVTLRRTQKVCFSPAGGLLLTSSSDRTSRIWNSKTGNCTQILSGHQGDVFSCAFSYAGDSIITASKDNTCKVWR